MTEPFLQLEQRHGLLGVVEPAGDRGPGPVAGDVAADVGRGDTGLAAEHRDDRRVDVALGDPAGPVGELRLGGSDGLPCLDGLAQERVAGLVNAVPVLWVGTSNRQTASPREAVGPSLRAARRRPSRIGAQRRDAGAVFVGVPEDHALKVLVDNGKQHGP